MVVRVQLPCKGLQGALLSVDFLQVLLVVLKLYAPKDLDDETLEVLSKALQDTVSDTRFIEGMNEMGAVAVSEDRATPESLEQHLKNQTDTWTPLIEAASVHLQ